MSVRLSVLLFGLAACGSIDADPNVRTESDAGEKGWWWLWTPDTTPEPKEPTEPDAVAPEEPGDPMWFDAHCGDDGCTVTDDFDPAEHLMAAHDLCADALDVEDSLYFQRVSFEAERVYTDDFRASEAAWEYRFVYPDPDDLWGYNWLECYVDVTGGQVLTDTTFNAGSVTRVENIDGTIAFGVADALEDLGSWSYVTRGGIRWDSIHDAGEVYLVDDRWDDFDSWNASTGERDW